jgi:hypothetical protein
MLDSGFNNWRRFIAIGFLTPQYGFPTFRKNFTLQLDHLQDVEMRPQLKHRFSLAIRVAGLVIQRHLSTRMYRSATAEA